MKPLREAQNPYAPPGTSGVTRTSARGGSLKWLFLVALAAGPVTLYVHGDAGVTRAVAALGVFASWGIGVAWFLVAWASVPPEDRHGTELGRYSLFWVFMRFMFPLYGLYWSFAATLILCRAINHSLAKRDMPMRTSALVGIAAAISLLAYRLTPGGPIGFIIAWTFAGGLWFLFMLQTDHARRFMILACLAERERNDATRRALTAR